MSRRNGFSVIQVSLELAQGFLEEVELGRRAPGLSQQHQVSCGLRTARNEARPEHGDAGKQQHPMGWC